VDKKVIYITVLLTEKEAFFYILQTSTILSWGVQTKKLLMYIFLNGKHEISYCEESRRDAPQAVLRVIKNELHF